MSWAYSTDGERYSGPFETRAEAIQLGLEEIACSEDIDQILFIGEVVPIDLECVVRNYLLDVEAVEEQVWDETGADCDGPLVEWDDAWLGPYLQNAAKEIAAHATCRWFTVGNVEELAVRVEDEDGEVIWVNGERWFDDSSPG